MLNCFKSTGSSRSSKVTEKGKTSQAPSKHSKKTRSPRTHRIHESTSLKSHEKSPQTKSTNSSKVPTSILTPTELTSLAHWSMYGRPGAPPASRVQKSDWGNTKSFKLPQSSPWNVALQPEQVQRLLLGFRPREMEDKWFVFAEGPDSEGRILVKFYRSWTGVEIAEVELKVGKGGKSESKQDHARVTGITWEESKNTVRDQREADAKQTVQEVCRWILGVELSAED